MDVAFHMLVDVAVAFRAEHRAAAHHGAQCTEVVLFDWLEALLGKRLDIAHGPPYQRHPLFGSLTHELIAVRKKWRAVVKHDRRADAERHQHDVPHDPTGSA